ncbi:flavodoxin family protein [Faecalicatena contorta]|uniref:Flavodoxin n=1 Tax=Faecalicatena contorta TaxID=39482 RepID=A0A315ZWT5_9FIRM|nr:flavodoxin family protein [Faecalicatena contorta]PWJ50096.1 flavodoxin [Faecalicatena contorta]SUQ14217.1 Flavodoxin [Faecalicatena contorta]
MKTAIRYYSKTGNTKKLADAISQAAGIPAETVEQPVTEPVDVLFLGSAVYAAGIDNEVKTFISALDKDKVKKVVNFSTAALLPSTYKQVKQLLEQKGIPVDEREFHCRGSFKMLHRRRPDTEDLKRVQEFVNGIINSGKR